MYVYMYLYMYIFTYAYIIHTYIYIYMYVYTSIYLQMCWLRLLGGISTGFEYIYACLCVHIAYLHVRVFLCVFVGIYMNMYAYIYAIYSQLQIERSEERYIEVGEDAWDAFSCRSLPAKEPRILWLFCGN